LRLSLAGSKPRKPLAEFKSVIDREEKHREHAAALRARYGSPALGRVLLASRAG